MMKKVLYFIVPVVVVIAATKFYETKEVEAASSSCILSAKEYTEADKKEVVIIDVRTEREYAYGHLEGAVLVDIYQRNFKDIINKLDKTKNYFVYCKTGVRSRSAVNYMRQTGFINVCDLEGGINYLTRAGVKLVK